MQADGQKGFTLIELLVAMGLTMVVMTSVIMIITVFLNDGRYNGLRDQAQDNARGIVDRLSHELRSATSVSVGSSGLLERAQPYDLTFETVNPSTTPSGTNASNQYRVRYCLDASQTLWRQTYTWTGSAPPLPSSTACPDTSSADYLQLTGGSPCCKELSDVTNEIGGDTTRPLFTYGPLINGAQPTLSQIQEVQVNVITDLNPGHLPGPSPQLTTGIFLRNENSPPQASVNVTQIGSPGDVQLNGTGSTDPNGQVLTYQWYNGGSCPTPSSPLSGGTSALFDAGNGFTKGSTYTFSLVVTDTDGLTSCASSPVVTIQ